MVTARPVALVVAILSALTISPAAWAHAAWAHAALVTVEPADGAILAQAPAVLKLTFNEPVAPLVMRLIGPSGLLITPGSVDVDNATILISRLPPLTPGTHLLSWRVTSADGHPVGGSLIFSVGTPTEPPAAWHLADQGERAALWAGKLALYVGLFVGVGGAFYRAWISDPGPHAAGALVAALLTGLIAVPVTVGVQGLDALDAPLAALRRREAWEAGLATAYGSTATLAAFALFAGLLSFAAQSPIVARAVSSAGLLGAGLALALSGHAATAAPQLISRPALFLHAVCVAFWVGSLLPLYASLRSGPACEELARFSRAIPLVLVLLAGSGLWLAAVQLGRIDALWDTGYGRVLACKLAAVGVLLMLAAANRYWLAPKSHGAVRPLATSIMLELGIALAILALVALWRFTPPPRTLLAAMPISIHLHGERAMVQLEIQPAGGRGATLLVLDGELRPLAVKETHLVLVNPAAGIEPIRHAAARVGENAWRVDDLRIPVAGRWQVRVELLVGDFDKVTIEGSAVLPRTP